MTEELFLVGKDVPRVEGVSKVTGGAKYVADFKPTGLIYCRLLSSPLAHARIKRIDTSKAEALPGVLGVLTYKDVPNVMYNSASREPKDSEYLPADEGVLDETVRFVGDRVAAVAAETERIAEKALELVEVEYEELPAVFDPEEAMKPGMPQISPIAENNIFGHLLKDIGDVEKGFAEADFVFERRYTVQRQQHCCIETRAQIASWDGRGKLTVWTPTQNPFSTRRLLSIILGLPYNKIRVITPTIGAGFGGKSELTFEPILALLAKKTKRPVKLVLSRSEDMVMGMRHPCILDLKIGFKKNGAITARQLRSVVNTGAYAGCGPSVTGAMGVRWCLLYNTPNMRYEGYTVCTNTPPANGFRGYGNPQASFATETMLDEIAEKLGMDPIALREKNRIRSGDRNPWVTDFVIESCGLTECMERGAERIGWSQWRESVRAESHSTNGSRKRGVGMAIALHNTSGAPAITDVSSAIVRVNEDATVTVANGAAEVGQGLETALAQIAGEVLGLAVDQVEVITGDTDRTPFDMGTFASRTAHTAGNAVMIAATKAKRELLEEAAHILEASPDDLDCKEGRIFVKGVPSRAVSIAEAAVSAQLTGPNPRSIVREGSYRIPSNAPPFAAQFAEVEVDTETGQVSVLRLVAAHDVGRAINPKNIEGQIEGAIQQGVGYALTENLVIDETTGRPLNANFTDYRMAQSLDMPKVEVIIVEPYEPTGPFGAKGASEICMVATAGAVANAIYDAIGARFRDLPITPEKILQALQEKGKSTV